MSGFINFVSELSFEYGRVDLLSGSIRRVIANNPSPFTFHGTGTYILGIGQVAVIDPGPADAEHIKALVRALQGETVTHMLITHTHNDHSPGAALLQEYFPDARSFAYGPHATGTMDVGDQNPESKGGDMNFQPDELVKHGDIISGPNWSVECVYTPGHTSNHMCYQLREEKTLFTGDHVMGWSTSVIAPPDGNMDDYMNSLELLFERDDELYWPTHGPAITEPKAHVKAFIAHRMSREETILEHIRGGQNHIKDIVLIMYKNHSKSLHPAAAMSVFATILRLLKLSVIHCDEEIPTLSSAYHAVS